MPSLSSRERGTFAELFEASLRQEGLGKEGDIVKGTVIALRHGHVVIDIGGKSEGMIQVSEFTDAQGQVTVKPGDQVDVYIQNRENDDGLITLSKEKADAMKVWDEILSACERDQLIDGTINKRVKGGLSVMIRGGVQAFLPGSQVDLRPIRNLDKLIGQTYQFTVIKFNKKRGNIVLSRRALLEKERDEVKAKTLGALEKDKIVKGVIKNITEYGAFVDLGGVDGLLHITDMSWGRVNHPNELFQLGDEVTLVVLNYNAENERVSLGLKQVQENPWNHAEEAYPPGKKVQGKIMSIADYGAFVELEPGVEGLIHVSEMSWTKKVKHPSKLLEIGQEVECQVLEVDAKNKRISLGIKQLEPDPWNLFIEKYHPGDKVVGKVRSLTDYGVFVGIEEGVDGMIHRTDISWTLKINNPADFYQKGEDVEAIILSINHDEKKVSLGVRQLFDDPWPALLNEFASGQHASARVIAVLDHGLFVKIRDGIEAHIPSSELITEGENRLQSYQKGDKIEAQVANIDTQERRLTLSMRWNEVDVQSSFSESNPGATTASNKNEKVARAKKASEEKPAVAGSIGELIKQKLGEKFGLSDDPEKEKV
ncbi:30S ribosomal protein S1 [Pajaroellobacter abortibovis]|uniref:Small ribosomal subunit protein bS1 n=1 Tax=Pajaroellobacter abortibovis TaxID=1882918 RepID=A0A1L6MZH1_9BACT|nr:30S ribosomal protein S1 [Pajaroellobacter abortibovis]